ncbi:hypothetical protein [Pyxidicoccus caerfyrddinensis]|uniref:hypothetical protein n=1 Tax=Pyxidicoccus caerfyrddinensis TaxID=2709663 RepID=UPI0013DB8CE3|nr:hypothetical protein [Pyxidicoccus caerfyrddinensis]
MTSCSSREDAALTEDSDDVPPGHVRLRSGQVVTAELAAQVLPAPRGGKASQRVREERSGEPEDVAVRSCACAHVEEVLAALAEERASRVRMEQLLQQTLEMLAQALESRPAGVPAQVPVSPPAASPPVPFAVPPSPGDAGGHVPRGRGDMKGGRGEAATATTKSERLRERDRRKKQKKRARLKAEKEAAAEDAREASPVPHPPSPGDASPSVPPGDMSPPARAPVPPAVRRKRAWMDDSPLGPEKAFFAWCQEARVARFPGAVHEAAPSGWGTWYAEALAAVGGDEERLRGAWLAWLEDAWGQGRRPVCPARAFIAPEVWRRHVPGQDVPADGSLPSVPVSAADARRRAALAVGRGEEPPRIACATGCGGISCTEAWGHALCPRCCARVEAEVRTWTGENVNAWVTSQQAPPAIQPETMLTAS